MKKKINLFIAVLLLHIFSHHAEAQIADFEGTARVTSGLPRFELYDVAATEDRVEAVFEEFSNDIYLSAFVGDLILGSSISGFQEDRVWIKASDGSVGIGESTPTARLHVKQQSNERALFLEGNDGNSDLGIRFENTDGAHFIFDDASSGHDFVIQSNHRLGFVSGGTFPLNMVIREDGNMGLGVTNPSSKLHIKQNTTERVISLEGSDGATDLAIQFNNTGGSHYIFDDADDGHRLKFESANSIMFNTTGANQRMEIDENGMIGMNINGASNVRLRVAGSTESYGTYSEAYGINANKYGVYASCVNYNANFNYYGIFGVASTTGSNSWAGFFNGDLTYTGTLTGPSDARLKNDIQDLQPMLSKVMQLKPKTYTYRQDIEGLNLAPENQIGFISQDIQKLFPELVHLIKHQNVSPDNNSDPSSPNETEILSLNYIALIPILTKAIQEQQEKINQLEQRIENMR